MVQRPRIHLPHTVEHRGEPEEFRDAALEVSQPTQVTVEQIEHVLPGAHRTLDTAQRVPGKELADTGDCDQGLLGRRGEPLTQGGGLGGDVVAAACHHQVPVKHGSVGQPGRDGHAAGMDQLQ